ncbi:MAG: agmatinase family protein [Bacteroidia bacterium]|nr:agmatinase family protein [Bacteroidia bacterium]
MSKEDKIKNFNPNSIGDTSNNIYGLPFTVDEANVVVLPVPWEVTVSYSSGTAKGPQAVYNASYQVDLYDPVIKDAWKIGVAMDAIDNKLKNKSTALRKKAKKYIAMYESGKNPESNKVMMNIQSEINKACAEMNGWVKTKALHFMNNNKTVALLGGDHSTPLGLMQALSEKHASFGILQIDAHADLRNAYEGFEFSHASIMFNALKIPQINKLVQVGIRDYCEEEAEVVNKSSGKIKTFYDRDIKSQQYEGVTWNDICKKIIAELPQKIYLSFDIDGLDPKLCPNTGTPVAGGFEFEQILFFIQKIVESGKQIIAFDINEVAPGKDEWDANVAARLLYRIAILVGKSNERK